jgi:predicted phage gp36 major capsid-like protein
MPRADASDPKAMIAALNQRLRGVQGDQRCGDRRQGRRPGHRQAGGDQRTLTDLQSALDDHSTKLAAGQLGGGGGVAADPDYTAKFSAYMRDGTGEAELKAANKTGVRAAMSEGSSADGGLITPIEWDRTITERLKLISPIRQYATVQSISKAGFTRLFTDRTIGSGWVGETAARPATSTPQFTALSFAPGEIYANAAASQDLLDDAEVNLDAWLTGEIDTEFSRQEGIAFLFGRRHEQAVRHPHLCHRRRRRGSPPLGRDPQHRQRRLWRRHHRQGPRPDLRAAGGVSAEREILPQPPVAGLAAEAEGRPGQLHLAADLPGGPAFHPGRVGR